MSADHDDDGSGVDLFDLLERLDSVDARHLHIEKHEMRVEPLVLEDAVDGVRHRTHFVTLELEELSECAANALFVIDDEDAPGHGYLSAL